MKAALDWLYSTQLFGIKLGLENTHKLLRAMDLPAAGQKFLHVAGTNGKGSTCAFAHSILREAGIHAGLFTSPHLIHFRERIRDEERLITPAELVAGIDRLRSLVRGWDPHPTFFELTLALALDWFRAREVEWVVLETGLGGRLDATNAVMPAACAITPIGHDHMDVLGGTLAEIAAEKAGIIKPGIPVVIAPQACEAARVLERTANERGAPLIRVTEPVGEEVKLGLEGPHQAWNAAVAAALVQAGGIVVGGETLRIGLGAVTWPGRFQRVEVPGSSGCVIIDGAHNAEGADSLIATWKRAFGQLKKARIVLGMVSGKEPGDVISRLEPIAAAWHVVALQSPRGLSAEALAAQCGSSAAQVHVYQSVREALQVLLSQGDTTPVLICGSLYLAGEALSLLTKDAAELEPSLQ